jgi:hypothetical protein
LNSPSSSRRTAKARRLREHYLKVRAEKKGKLYYFAKLLDGMSEQDLSFVANLESMSCRIRMYDAINRKLVAVGDLLPWPVVFVMLR